MFKFFFTLPDFQLFVILSVLLIGFSLVAIALVTRFVPLDFRYRDNAVLGYISGLISIIYGVLVGLTALYLINNMGFITDAVQQEANAVANIYRDTQWLHEPERSQIQSALKRYLTDVIDVEWPQMQKGVVPSQADSSLIDNIDASLTHYKITNNSESLIISGLITEIKTLYNARESRIQMTTSELNTQIWVVIVIGTVLILMITYLFGMHLYLHILTVSATALMTSAMIFLLVSLDRPFQGDFVIEPSAFRYVLQRMNAQSPKLAEELDQPILLGHAASLT